MSYVKRPEELILFLDRNLGKRIIAERLRQEGLRVEIHDDHLPPDAPDEEWIALVGKKRWVALTKDKNIRYRLAEIDSIERHSARVIVIRAKNATGLDIAELLAKGKNRIARFALNSPAPFVAGIDRSGSVRPYGNLLTQRRRSPEPGEA